MTDNTILVFHETDGTTQIFRLPDEAPMPYTPEGMLTVGDFKAGCSTPLLWTTRLTMEMVKASFVGPVRPVEGFRRLYCRPVPGDYRHFAGTALAVRGTQLQEPFPMWNSFYMVGDVLHLSMGEPSPSPLQPFPTQRLGDRSVYTAVLQDGLNLLGEDPGPVDGVFGRQTREALRRFQNNSRLEADGVAGLNTWNTLLTLAILQDLTK